MNQESEYSLSWDGHVQHVRRAFNRLLQNNELCDVILYVEGQKIEAHKVFLSTCSKYFEQLFKEFKYERPIIALKGIQYDILKYILKFIYNGEVNVDMKRLNEFLEAAAFLEINGLTENNIKRKRRSFLIEEPDNTIEQTTTSQITAAIEKEGPHYLRTKMSRESFEKTSQKPPKMYKIDNSGKRTQAANLPDFSKAPVICKYSLDTSNVEGEWLSDYEFSSQSTIIESQSPENTDHLLTQENTDRRSSDPPNINPADVKSEYTCVTVDSDIDEVSSFDQNDFANSLDAEIDYTDNDDDVLEKYLMKTPFASIDEQGLYQCKICNKSYAKKDSLKKHFAVHANNTTCNICGKMLSRRTHLIRHYLGVHGVRSE